MIIELEQQAAEAIQAPCPLCEKVAGAVVKAWTMAVVEFEVNPDGSVIGDDLPQPEKRSGAWVECRACHGPRADLATVLTTALNAEDE